MTPPADYTRRRRFFRRYEQYVGARSRILRLIRSIDLDVPHLFNLTHQAAQIQIALNSSTRACFGLTPVEVNERQATNPQPTPQTSDASTSTDDLPFIDYSPLEALSPLTPNDFDDLIGSLVNPDPITE